MDHTNTYISKDSTTAESSKRLCWDCSPTGLSSWTFEYTVRGGEKILSSDGAAVEVGEGAAVLISPGTPRNLGHAPGCPEWTRFFCIFSPPPHWSRLLRWPEIYPGAMVLNFENPLRRKIEAGLEEALEVQRSAWELRAEMTENLLEQVLLWCHTANPASRQAAMHEGIRKAMHFMRRRFAEPIGIDDVARHAGLSRSHFIRLFHQVTGTTPRRFIEDCRIGEATHLLRTRNLSAAEIAFSCGFTDPARFSRVFKSRTGHSPSALRQHGIPSLQTQKNDRSAKKSAW
jgi:AraC-like DNA-binding protein